MDDKPPIRVPKLDFDEEDPISASEQSTTRTVGTPGKNWILLEIVFGD
jgi:hypothetical protein